MLQLEILKPKNLIYSIKFGTYSLQTKFNEQQLKSKI